LALADRDGQLQIRWNHSSRSITSAQSASIEITDGGTGQQIVVLSAPQLASGSIAYARRTGDVQVRMRLKMPAGAIEEASRFLGNPPPNSGPEAEVNKAEKEQLQDEVERLRGQNRDQAQRIQRLERTLTILRSRLGISEDSR